MTPTTLTPEAAPEPLNVQDATDAHQGALQAHQDAEMAVTTLQRAIVAGDTTISRDQLDDGRSQARFTALRLQAAKRRLDAAVAAVSASDAAAALTVAGPPAGVESQDDRRTRHLAGYDHTHTPTGSIIHLTTTQDGAAPGCPSCGRRGPTEPWQHQIGCPAYTPHPASIAATHTS